jgi:hypothetical protein
MTELSEELRALGRHLDAQPRDDLADQVMLRIDAPVRPVARTRKWRRLLAALAALLVAIGVSAAVSAPVRAAIVHVFRFGGSEVRQEPGPAPASSPALPGEHSVDLAAAGREVGFRVRTPNALPPPTSITVADGRVVSLRYSLPSGPARIDEFAGNLGVMWEKYAAAGMAQRVQVNGRDALWFNDPVTLVYVLPDGARDDASTRVTNGTLVWTDSEVTYRIDGIRPVGAAVAAAESMS